MVENDYYVFDYPMIFRWFSRLFGTRMTPLTGAPLVRRQKTYSAESGYVYQYFYQGCRDAQRENESGTEYVFDVSADRRNSLPVSVFLEHRAVEMWQRQHGRELGANERYAIAKMALFHAFDERPEPALMKHEVRVRAADAEGFLSVLGID